MAWTLWRPMNHGEVSTTSRPPAVECPAGPRSDRSREGAVGYEETIMLDNNQPSVPRRDPWNKGRPIGQKRPLKPKDVWSIRVRLQVERRARNMRSATRECTD